MKGLLQFLGGILLVQLITAGLAAAALRSQRPELWGLLALIAVGLGLLAAFWFTAMMAQARREARAELEARHLKERERLKVRAEREKSRLREKSQKELARAKRKADNGTRKRTTLAFTAVAAAGGLMLFTQFITFGLLLVTGAGGALAGYALRWKQSLPRRAPEAEVLPAPRERKLIEKS